MILFAARHHLAKELKVGLTYLIVQITCGPKNDTPLHHVAILCRLHRGYQLVGSLHKGWLTYHQFLHILALQSLGIHHLFQFKAGVLLVELLQGHFIVVGLRVAQLRTTL